MSKISIESLTEAKVQKFIYEHDGVDERVLVLKHKTIEGIDAAQIAQQISGRKKAKLKLPLFYQTPNIIYPARINLEQCSSETTAKFKANLIDKGKKILDLTGGFGVDTFFLNKNFEESHYVEPNEDLLAIAKHNHSILGAHHVHYHNTSAEEFLSSTTTRFDLILIDPSRRSTDNQKVFKLSDCVPDITKLQEMIFTRTDKIIVKASPWLDLHQALKELKFVERICVVSVENECKEVLFILRNGFGKQPLIETINFVQDSVTDFFSFKFSDEESAIGKYSDPLLYLYEPNASILKAGAFKSIGIEYQLNKIQTSTHLYTSESLRLDFPGKIFKVEAFVKPETKILKQYFFEYKANITTRNYPLTPQQLKAKTGLKDGGEKFLIGFSGKSKKFLAVALRLK